MSNRRHVCCVTWQTRLLCHTEDNVRRQKCLLCQTADTSVVSHSRHVCRTTQQTCLLCHTEDIAAVSHSRHVLCVTQQTCLPCHKADMFAVSHRGRSDSRNVCCVRQSRMSAVSHRRHVCCTTQQTCQLTPRTKVFTVVRASANSQDHVGYGCFKGMVV